MEPYVEGPYLVVDQPDGSRKVVGYAPQAQSNTVITKRANPTEQRGDQLKNELTQAQIAKMIADMNKGDKPNLPTGYRMKADGSGAELIPGVAPPNVGDKGGVTAKIRSDALQAFNDATALRRAATELRGLNKTGPGATSGFGSVYDYLPTEANQGFNEAAQRARGYVKRSLGFTGGEGNTVAESSSLYDPYLPSTWDKDGNILGKITALEGLAADAERKAIATLGGVPDQFGNISQPQSMQAPQEKQDDPMAALPVQGGQPPAGPQGPDTTNPIIGSGNGAPLPGGFAPYGAKTRIEADPARAGLNSEVLGMIKGGVSPAVINQHIASRGGVPASPQVLQQAIAFAAKNPKWQGVDLETREVPMTGMQQFANNAPQTRLGTAATMAANAGGLGIPQMLAGDEGFDYLRAQNPGSALAGDVAGVIGGTAAIGKAGASVAGKFAPGLLGGGKRAALGRQVATDATYGGIYGGTTEGDPLSGALAATAGSLGGQVAGKGIQRGLQGVMDPAVQGLTSRNIPLTIGQTLGNRGIMGRTMNKLESLPLVGDMMNGRRVEGLKAFEREALNDVVAPVGGAVQQGGAEGLEQAQGFVSDAYGKALDGVNIPGDQQFINEAGAALNKGRGIPTMGDQFEYGMQQRIGPLFDGGQLSGREFQAATQNLRKMGSGFRKQGAMGDFADEAVGEMDGALQGLVGRQAPDVMPQFNAANEAFRKLAPFENARIGAINQEAISPAQLARAITTGNKNFGGRGAAARGDQLTDLVKYGQEVLPSTVPNSGTADRGLAALLLPTALGGGAAYSGLQENPGTAGVLATLAAMSTKQGQKAIQAALVKRPDSVRRVGGLFGRRKAQQLLAGAGSGAALSYFGE